MKQSTTLKPSVKNSALAILELIRNHLCWRAKYSKIIASDGNIPNPSLLARDNNVQEKNVKAFKFPELFSGKIACKIRWMMARCKNKMTIVEAVVSAWLYYSTMNWRRSWQPSKFDSVKGYYGFSTTYDSSDGYWDEEINHTTEWWIPCSWDLTLKKTQINLFPFLSRTSHPKRV